jgi:muramoyltetrapeptide carboxypeptidase LdcA involved in peptidoglycan recycling
MIYPAIYPAKPTRGARVAVLSPAAGVPQIFPEVYELGLRRLRDELGLEPVEYPTTRVLGAPAADRARDLHAAFADPDIGAVLATIGGDDQITVLRHLDPDVLRANPKPFFGYSDNTNLLNYLWRLGIVGYHGGSVMVHLGRAGRPHPAHVESLRAAVFGSGWFELKPPEDWGDEPVSWKEPDRFGPEPPMWPHEGWQWVRADRVVVGRTWGGNLEIISWLLQAGFAPPDESLTGCVLYLETSEEMPSATEVYRILRNMGERGLLARFPAVLMGRPKAWDNRRRTTADEKREYIQGQHDAVLRAMAEYHPDALVVLDVDFGHTDPQLIIPNGGDIRIDGPARRIEVRY